MGVFHFFLNCTNGTKPREASQFVNTDLTFFVARQTPRSSVCVQQVEFYRVSFQPMCIRTGFMQRCTQNPVKHLS